MAILVIGEHDNSVLKPSTLNAVTAAGQLGSEVDLLVAGSDCGLAAEHAARVAGVSRVLKAEAECLADALAENLVPLIVKLAEDYPCCRSGINVWKKRAARGGCIAGRTADLRHKRD